VTERAFELAKVPFNDNMADGIQVLRYEPGQAYIPHTDYFELNTSPDHNWDAR
jgi:prolyl 4-hydroxylase